MIILPEYKDRNVLFGSLTEKGFTKISIFGAVWMEKGLLRQPIRKLQSVPAARDVIRLPKIIVAGRVIPLDIYNLNYVIDISVIILLIYSLNCY